MQATLLGIAFALILALVAALVGPAFFPWNNYRAAFETETSRLTGLPLRITGPIDARILPTPKLTLKGVEITSQSSSKARIGDLRLEFSLGALIRGERRVAELHLDGPDLAVTLDASGRVVGLPNLDLPNLGKFEPDLVTIEKLIIENGRVALSGAGGTNLSLEKLDFSGDLRSLAGPVKGEGSFVAGGLHYPYRIGAGRVGDDGALRVKLTVDPIDRPIAEADGVLTMAGGVPRFEGAVTLTRGVGLAQSNGRAVVSEPWRLASRVKSDGAGAVLEQIELQYGPEDRAIKLRGDARVSLGIKPQIEGVLSAPSLDIDRVLSLPDESRRKPLAVIKGLGSYFAGGQRLPIPVKLGLSADTVTFAGALLQRVSGDVTLEADGWDIEQLEFRAPGFAQLRMSGRLSGTQGGASFAGPVKLEANDPRAFIAWLTDRSDLHTASIEPLRLAGDVTIGSETIGVEHLKAELDRVAIEGRFAYHWPNGDKPARFDAALRAPELDIDRAASVVKAAFSDTSFDWPREGTLAFEVGRATLAGVDARNATGRMWLDRTGFMVERLAVADFGGAALSGSGRIDTAGAAPRGTMVFELDARRLDGATALLDKVSPRVAELLRRASARVASAKLNATLSLDDPPAKAPGTLARFTLDGRVGEVRLVLNGGATGEALSLGQLVSAKPNLRMNAKVEADDAGVLIGLLGLERVVAAEKRQGQMIVNASGPLYGELRLDAQVAGAGFDAKADGTARLLGAEGPQATLRLDVANADLRQLRPMGAARAALAAKLKGKLAWRAGALALDEIESNIGGTALRGNLTYDFAAARKLGGEIVVDAIDLSFLVGAMAGVPAAATGAPWPSEPFGAGPLDTGMLGGRVAVLATKATLTPRLTIDGMRGVLVMNGPDITLDNIEGVLAGGRVTGQLAIHRDAAGLTGRANLALARADAATLLPGARQPVTGKLSLEIGLDGTGLSPAALIGSLGGAASFKLEDATISGIDPRAFDLVIRAVDQGLALERIGNRAEQVMGPGKLTVPRSEGTITILGGQARLGGTNIRTETAELTLSGGVNLATNALDARIALASLTISGDMRPEIVINLKGPAEAPQRSLDLSSFASWLALRAVEQQAKRLDAIQESRRDPALNAPAPPALQPPPAPAAVQPQPAIIPAPPPARAAPTLPPPINIRPGPAPRSQSEIPRADVLSR